MKFIAMLLTVGCAIIAAHSSAQAESFGKIIQKAYLKECVGDEEPTRAYCQCTLDEMQKTMTLDEFNALGELNEKEMEDHEKFSDAIVACIDHMPQE